MKQAAVISFRNAMAVEKIHHDLYAEALESLKAGKDLPDSEITDGCYFRSHATHRSPTVPAYRVD
jgi:rubrerythrin